MKSVLQRPRFRRFSTVQLLIVALLFTAAPFVEEIKRGGIRYFGFVLPGVAFCRHCRRGSQTHPSHRACACAQRVVPSVQFVLVQF